MDAIHSLTTLAVQWQIGNQCNYRCDYCHHDYHDGSNPFLDFDKFKTAFDNLNSAVSHDRVIIEFQGGEPSICPPVRDLLTGPVNPRFKYLINTNASQDLVWWTSAVRNLEGVILSYHPGYCSSDHFKQVLAVVKNAGLEYTLTINAPPDQRWRDAVKMYEDLAGEPVQLRALFANHARGNDKFLVYNEEQWAYYTKVNNIKTPVDEPVETQIEWVEDHLYNNYKGHLCWAGVDQIVIDYFGYVYRGWCHAHGSLGNVFDAPPVLDKLPKVCPYKICKNSFDLEAKKSVNSWGL